MESNYCSGLQGTLEMEDGIEGAGQPKHTYLDEVVAEGEEGVEGADAEVRDVELRSQRGREEVRSGQARRALYSG